MARERSILVRLKAEVSDFQSKMGQASRSLSDFEKAQQKLGGAADTAMGRLVQSAQVNEREWTQVGSALMVAGGAITGLGAAALKTGVQYNTLQQTTRAALTTIFQDGAKANQQMDALDNFARNSPFAKQVFIEAQQQMLGFGIEAQKVLPYLDSIQNAVAATGGSNQDIAELATVFSQVHANAKITARELMMFGQRGVDAATIIGEQMGYTGAEIREQITAGTLDAGEALDALAAGMDENFGGAAANVKETFEGAWDRIKAAWRDLSSELAAPLVDPQGGGIAIDVLNGIADAMRQFIDAPAWVKGTTLALGGLTGAVALGGGAFMMALPKFVEISRAIETLTNTHPKMASFATGLQKVGIAIGQATTAIAAFSIAAQATSKFFERDYNVAGLGRDLQEFGSDVGSARAALDEFVAVQGSGLTSITDMQHALEVLDYGDFIQFMDQAGSVFGIFDTEVGLAEEGLASFDETLMQLAQSGNQEAVNLALEAYSAAAADAGVSTERAMEHLPLYNEYLAEVEGEQAKAAEAADQLSGSFLGIGASAEDAQDVMENWASTLAEASSSFGGILEAYDAVIEKQGETQYSTEQTMEQWIEELQAQAKAHEDWSANVVKAMEQANTESTGQAQEMHAAFVEEMTAAGVEGAAALQTFVDGTPEQRAELVEAWAGTKDDIQAVLDASDDPNIGIDVDPEQAETKVNEILAWIGEKTADPLKVDADTSGAEGDVDFLLSYWAGTTTDTNVDANTGPADGTFRGMLNSWTSTTTDTNVDANRTPADNTFRGMVNQWSSTTTDTNLSADDSPARNVFGGFTSNVASTTTSTKIDADTSPAQSAWSSFKSSIGNITTRISAIFTGGAYEGGWINPGRYQGGHVLPGRQAGGRVPGPRAGRDNILWPLHSGGQILSQPLEGGEFVVRSSQAPNYTQELYAMNNGSFPTGMMERLYSSSTAGAISVQVPAPPVDTAAIGAAVASAIRSYQPVVNIGGRQFAGVMQEVQQQYVARR